MSEIKDFNPLSHYGIRIDPDKSGEFKRAAIENARSHGKEYWDETRRLIQRGLDFERVDKLCGYK